MSDERVIVPDADSKFMPEDWNEQLQAVFHKSRFRDEIDQADAIPYEECLPGICRDILLARHDEPPERNQPLFESLNALRWAAYRTADDTESFGQLPAKLQRAVYVVIETDPWALSVKGKRGRPKATASERVAKVTLREYQRLFSRAKASHSPDGDFVNLLTGIFGVLQIDDNAEHAAHKVLKAKRKK